jgi:hypothetical protein
MNLRDLPLETLAEISAFLPLPYLGLLLLSGDAVLLQKLKNGGVSSIRAEVVHGYLRELRFKDAYRISRKYTQVSLTPAFQVLKGLRQVQLHDKSLTSRPLATSNQFLLDCGQNLVKVWIRSTGVYRLFLNATFLEYVSNTPAIRKDPLVGISDIVKICQSYNQRFPGQELDPWLPISSMLPSIRSLNICAPIRRHGTIDQAIAEKMFANFQRLLPSSLSEFGTNVHCGEQPILMESLPAHLEVLNFEQEVWMSPNKVSRDLDLVCSPAWPKTLEVLRWPKMESFSGIPALALTTLLIRGNLNDFVSFLPHTLTSLKVVASLRTRGSYSAAIHALPRSLTSLRLHRVVSMDFLGLPPALLHLCIKGLDELEWEQLKSLPKTLTYLRLIECNPTNSNFFSEEFAAMLPNLTVLRVNPRYDPPNVEIDGDCIFPPHLTHLQSNSWTISETQPPQTFGSITQLHLMSATISEEFMIHLPMQIYVVKFGTIELQGLLARHDSNLIHLSGRTLVTNFESWVKNQMTYFGRDVFVNEITIGEIQALPMCIQSISRKLRLSPLISLSLLPTSLTSLSQSYNLNFDGLGQLPSSLKSCKGLTIRIPESEAPKFLNGLDPSLTRISLPHQLASTVARLTNAPDDAFEIKLYFNRELILLLPSSLTQLTLSQKFDWSLRSESFPPIPTLQKLVINSGAVVRDIIIDLDSKFPVLRELSLTYANTLISYGLKSMPNTLTSLTVLKSNEDNFPTREFRALPRQLLYLSIKQRCTMVLKNQLEALPQSLTSLELNAELTMDSIPLLPPSLTFFKCAKNSYGMSAFRRKLKAQRHSQRTPSPIAAAQHSD